MIQIAFDATAFGVMCGGIATIITSTAALVWAFQCQRNYPQFWEPDIQAGWDSARELSLGTVITDLVVGAKQRNGFGRQ